MKTVISLAGIIVGALLLSILAYYIGSAIAKSFLSAGGVKYSTWQHHYFSLVVYMGSISGIMALVWYLMARFVIKIEGAFNIGRRTLWSLIGVAEVVLCFAVPYIVAVTDTILKMSISIPVLFILLYALLGYWVGSIFFTPEPFKYTPVGAMMIRAPKGRK